ncbi:MAG: DUF5057 domain-containing protein, partial [Lachnospiraceae bacterium]|nr:DUF5057 domain-containing protein [Lachnospiraceae bacterium]
MLKRNKKLTLIALVAMLFMAVAVTFLSFSKADEDLSGDELDLVAAGNSLDVGSKTNIDYIIQNANSTETDVDKNYHIIEIYSGSPSALGTYISSGKFAGLVINENRTTKGDADDKEIDPKNIDFKAYKASSISNTDTELLVEISNADLIYINQDSTVFKSPNDLAEKLYDILHTYAVGDYKPIIFNSQATSGSNSGNNTEKPTSVNDLVSKVFSSGSYYYTFAWKDGVDVDNFLAHKNGSLYLAINGTKQSNKGKWATLVDKADSTKTKTMSKFLVVTNGTESSKMNELLISTDSDVTATLPGNYKVGDAEFDLGTSKLYDRTKIKSNIYNLKYAVPDYIQLDQKKLTELDDVDLAQYDFIYIDSSVGGASTISEAIYTKFAGAMYGNVSIVYDGGLGSSTTSTTTTTTTTNTQETNYLELYYMVATQDNLSRYNNVMITEPNQFAVIMSGDTAAAGAIAELINASTYRGIGGKSSSSNMFTVLEIQPCYPIDRKAADAKGYYYTIPANVLNDVDKSTLPTDASGNITVEYYDWELTKAKIADAVGIDVNQVNVVHMSTEELAASKEPLLGTYDLIYIGGNQSALKTDTSKWQSIANVGGNGNNVSNLGYNDNGIAKLPIYTMYSHNGDIAIISDGPFSSGTRGSGTPVPKVKVNGSYKDTFALLNGNDISYDRLIELEDYVKAKMPVIIEDDVSLAYEIIAGTENVPGKGYLQNAIDPDCNMYKFLKFCNEGDYITTTGETDGRKHTVLWKVDNTSDDLTFTTGGDAKSDGTIRVDENKKVNSLIIGSNTRPKLTVTSLPTIYNFYDKTTRLDSKDLKFAFEVAGSTKYDVKLYVDDNGNSVFADDEVMEAEVTKTGNS